ncbi:hypothetical protein [Pseudomonas nitroreducens]|uniref:hypothetical protein n=1 Tax=Pseudomonas nitroreducens TaxID=46680 RepID=UPI001C870B56|nr:hypothetical protein [Pseudomonas nitritireducens]
MTAAAFLQREIVRRLNGRCHVNLANGKNYSLLGEKLEDSMSCATCLSPCDSRSSGLILTGPAEALGMKVAQDGERTLLKWACPGCGNPVQEDTSPLMAHIDAEGIAQDPTCHNCRRKSS